MITVAAQYVFSTYQCSTQQTEQLLTFLRSVPDYESVHYTPDTHLLSFNADNKSYLTGFLPYAAHHSPALKQLHKLSLTGLACSNCETGCKLAVERALTEAKIDIDACSVNFYPTPHITLKTPLQPTCSAATLIAAINGYEDFKDLGYHCEPFKRDSIESTPTPYLRRAVINLTLGGLLMVCASFGWLPSLLTTSGWLLNLGLSLSSGYLMYATSPDIYQKAWSAAKLKTTNMETLIALGTGFCWLFGLIGVLFPTQLGGHMAHHLLEGTLLLGTINLTRWAKARAKQPLNQFKHTVDAYYHAFLPSDAMKVTESGPEPCFVDNIKQGDVLTVAPQQIIPCDGVLLSPAAPIRNRLNGETAPREVKAQGLVYAGSRNCGQTPIKIAATTSGKRSQLRKLIDKLSVNVNYETTTRSPIIDKIAKYFIVSTISIAAFTGIGWLLAGASLSYASHALISVLMCVCPCSLTLAAPMAHRITQSQLSRDGIYIKSMHKLETLAPKHIFFDKTGTLTTCALAGDDILNYQQGYTTADLIQLAASIETMAHPIGQAMIDAAAMTATDGEQIKVQHRRNCLRGVQGVVEYQGRPLDVFVGEYQALCEQQIIHKDSKVETDIAAYYERGQTVTCLVMREQGTANARVAALLPLTHTLRADAKDTITWLKAQGITPWILTGDQPETAQQVATALNISHEHVKAALSPAQKAEIVEAHTSQEQTMMVGDGINDTIAGQAATACVAIRMTDHMHHIADITLSNQLSQLQTVLKMATATTNNIQTSLYLTLTLNAFNLSLAISGLHTIFMAPVLITLSYITIIANALRLQWVNNKPLPTQSNITPPPVSVDTTSTPPAPSWLQLFKRRWQRPTEKNSAMSKQSRQVQVPSKHRLA